MSSTTTTENPTDVRDADHNLIWYTDSCLSRAARLATCVEDAELDNDPELAEFFRDAHTAARQTAARAKALLAERLGRVPTQHADDDATSERGSA